MPEPGAPLELELVRSPGHAFRRIVVVLAEGLGLFRNAYLTERVCGEWTAAGRPQDWLFIVTGAKSRRHWHAPVKILSNTSQKDMVIDLETEHGRLYCGLARGGVPVTQIIVESKSDTTAGQRTFVHELLQEVLVTPPPGPYPVTLACVDLHAPRAVGIFNKGGLFTVEPVEGVGVIMDPYFPDYSADLADRGNWFQVLWAWMYVSLERLATYRDLKSGYLDEVAVIQRRPGTDGLASAPS